MKISAHTWINEADGGHTEKVDVTVERTDEDEVAIFAIGASDTDDIDVTLYLSTAMAVRLATMLGIFAHAHEIQAHEAANITARSSQ